MSETEVDVPGIGNVKKEYLYGGVALVAGIGGYAWWKARKSSSSNAPVVLNPNDVVPATDYQGAPTGNATQNVDSTGTALTTNAKWTTYVVEKLATYGFDPVVASAALGKWIARSSGPYSSTDIEVIQRAIGLAGYPPENGPWTVPAPSTTTPSTGGGSNGALSKPGNLHINPTPGIANLVWDGDADATGYRITVKAPSTGKEYVVTAPGTGTNSTTGYPLQMPDKGVRRDITVTPFNASGDGPSASISYTS